MWQSIWQITCRKEIFDSTNIYIFFIIKLRLNKKNVSNKIYRLLKPQNDPSPPSLWAAANLCPAEVVARMALIICSEASELEPSFSESHFLIFAEKMSYSNIFLLVSGVLCVVLCFIDQSKYLLVISPLIYKHLYIKNILIEM